MVKVLFYPTKHTSGMTHVMVEVNDPVFTTLETMHFPTGMKKMCIRDVHVNMNGEPYIARVTLCFTETPYVADINSYFRYVYGDVFAVFSLGDFESSDIIQFIDVDTNLVDVVTECAWYALNQQKTLALFVTPNQLGPIDENQETNERERNYFGYNEKYGIMAPALNYSKGVRYILAQLHLN